MKFNVLISIIVSLFLMAASNVSLAESGGDKERSEYANCPHHLGKGGAEMDKKLEQLHQNLKLTDVQEPLWKDWTAKLLATRDAWKKNKADHEAWKNLKVIERMEKRLALTRERLAGEESSLASAKALYAQLTDAQRKTFDEQFPFGHHGDKDGGDKNKR
ncbi:Spy/CpxP family protein refolding chaperone [Candidatus Methylospira mobilis]|nr:Spy/CpxP family protein refolding chaperone [Candidatus Methylospira mobilis]WNV06597.1 Spy/CpxP family protein refolding chaperone [Candidatus Methylospira mobilis]